MKVILTIAAAAVLASALVAALTGRVKGRTVIASVLTLAALCLAGFFLFRPSPVGDAARQHRVYSGGTRKDALTAVVSDSGRLYVRGDNHLYSFADRNGPFDTPLGWTCIMKNVKSYHHNNTVGSSALVMDCSFALTFDGALYGWGFYDDNTNPYGSPDYYARIMDDVASFACGSDCLAVTAGGELWAWGCQAAPAKLMDGVLSVYAWQGLDFAVDDNGGAYVWGEYAGAELASPVQLAQDVSELSLAWESDGDCCVQLLSSGGELSLLNISAVLALGEPAAEKAAENVRALCTCGYIDAGGTLYRWQSGGAVPVAEDVISADCSDAGAICISGGELRAVSSDNALITRASMLRFW